MTDWGVPAGPENFIGCCGATRPVGNCVFSVIHSGRWLITGILLVLQVYNVRGAIYAQHA